MVKNSLIYSLVLSIAEVFVANVLLIKHSNCRRLFRFLPFLIETEKAKKSVLFTQSQEDLPVKMN